MAEKKRKDDIGKLNFEESIKQLQEIVGRIEQGEIPLQDSLDQYERGMDLIKHCRGILQKAEKRIEKIAAEEAAGEAADEGSSASEAPESADEGLF